MAIISMTGFGRAEEGLSWGKFQVVVKSVNHRFLDINVRLPLEIVGLELEIKELVKKHLNRGKVSVYINLEKPIGGISEETQKRAEDAFGLLEWLRNHFNIADPVDLNTLLSIPWLDAEAVQFDPSERWPEVESVIMHALDELKHMKTQEGKSIEADLLARIDRIEEMLQPAQDMIGTNLDRQLKKLKQKIESIKSSTEIDENRLAQEALLMAERADISEELVRLSSHFSQFRDYINAPNDSGRKLNFLLQEMHREANTIGSKTDLPELSYIIVEIKEEIEKLREQIQNVE
jgi:uncharacterized protein (TIGR00255 family)